MELFTIPVCMAVSLLSGIKSFCGVRFWKENEYKVSELWTEKRLYIQSGLWMLFYFSIWFAAGRDMNAVRLASLVTTYGILAWIDEKRRIVPDLLLGCFLTEQMLMGAMVMRPETMLKLLLSGVGFTMAAAGVAWFSRGKIGMGDIRLLGVTAMIAGWGYVLQILFYAMLLSFFYSLYLITVKKKTVETEFPFVPFLAAGLAVHMLMHVL